MVSVLAIRNGAPPPIVVGPTTPTLVQMISSAVNNAAEVNETGSNNYKYRLPNQVLAGNCLIIFVSYPVGAGPSVSDSVNGSWGAAVASQAGNHSQGMSAFVFPNAGAGWTDPTIAFSTPPPNGVQFEMMEWNGLALSSVFNGSSGTPSVAPPNLSCGSFTPTTNNDVNGGNLILSYFAVDFNPIASNPSTITAGTGHTLLEAGIENNDNQGIPHACQYTVQAAQASINPGITFTGQLSTDLTNCLAVALKAKTGAGQSPAVGIRIAKILHFKVNASKTSWPLQCPTVGDFRLLFPSQSATTTVDDSEGGTNSFTLVNGANDANISARYQSGKTANPNLKLTFQAMPNAGANAVARFYDIVGAAAGSPIGAVVNPADQSLNGASSVSNWPSLTPQQANDLIVCWGGLGLGPGLTVTSPTNAVFDMAVYTNATDQSIDDGDLGCHYYNPNTSALNFNWTITTQATNSGTMLGFEIKHA